MSFGYCGSISNAVSANLRIDSSGVRFTAAADVVLAVDPNSTKTVTFTVIVPKNVGYTSIPWATLIADADSIDYAGWITDGKLVSGTTSTTLALFSSTLDITTANPISTDPADTLFSSFTVSYILNNTSPVNSFNVQKVIVGFTYNRAPPNTGQAKFDIYPSVSIS